MNKTKLTRAGGSVAIPQDVAERAATRYAERNGCWLSTYAPGSHGYPQVGWMRRGERGMVGAHRAAWTHHRGPIPVGMTVDHLCHVRQCVNPRHLRLLPNVENARDNGSTHRRKVAV